MYFSRFRQQQQSTHSFNYSNSKYEPDSLNKYLPNYSHQKQETPLNNFTTTDQINRSIAIQRDRFNSRAHQIYKKLQSYNDIISKSKSINRQLLEKIENEGFQIYHEGFQTYRHEKSYCSGLSKLFPHIQLSKIQYPLKQMPKQCFSMQNQKICILQTDIQKMQKQCAELYIQENENFQKISFDLFSELDFIRSRCLKDPTKAENTNSSLDVIKIQSKLKDKIQNCQINLTNKLQGKIQKMIQKIEAQM